MELIYQHVDGVGTTSQFSVPPHELAQSLLCLRLLFLSNSTLRLHFTSEFSKIGGWLLLGLL